MYPLSHHLIISPLLPYLPLIITLPYLPSIHLTYPSPIPPLYTLPRPPIISYPPISLGALLSPPYIPYLSLPGSAPDCAPYPRRLGKELGNLYCPSPRGPTPNGNVSGWFPILGHQCGPILGTYWGCHQGLTRPSVSLYRAHDKSLTLGPYQVHYHALRIRLLGGP